MRKIGKIQKRILEVLAELTRRNKRDWFSLQFITVFLYHQGQVDPEYGSNPSRLGKFILNWSYSENERRRIWESSRALEKRELIQIKIVREKEGKEKGTFGVAQKWLELRLKR
jgi:hypothetical protein